jgi:hypothetical protein
MKKLFLMVLTGIILTSCSTTRKSYTVLAEDELMITRKYVGYYVDYRLTDPEEFRGVNIIWIKTSRDSTYGKISAYGRRCEFSPGDRLYLRRTYLSPGGISGYWIYKIENDASVTYKLTEFQHDREVSIGTWF